MIPQEFLDAAKRITQLERELYPGCEAVKGQGDSGSVGVQLGSGNYSTQGSRYGTGTAASWNEWNVPRNTLNGNADQKLLDAVFSHYTPSTVDSVRKEQAKTFLSTMLGKTDSDSPGYSQLTNFLDTSPTTFPGATQLSDVAARDPYSGSFELETENAYKQRAGDAMAQAATGPEAVRGGASRTGIMQAKLADLLAQGRGQEVRQAQNQEADITRNAALTYSGISNAIRQQVLNSSLGLAQAIGGQQERQLGSAKTVSSGQLIDANILNTLGQLMGVRANQQNENFASNENATKDDTTWNIGFSP